METNFRFLKRQKCQTEYPNQDSSKRRIILLMLFSFMPMLYLSANSEQMVQPITVTGTVIEASTGDPIPGVNIYAKENPTRGAITDFDGKYTIVVNSEEDILVFSFVGYQQLEIVVGNQRVLNVEMELSTQQLDDVVVVGYGTQKKQSVVGAIATTSGDEIKKMNVPEISNALTGMVSGLVTIQQNSRPGSDVISGAGMEGSTAGDNEATQIYIRGQSTWNGGQPLILVDGIERRMTEVDPNEIKSLSVLKDASATAVFGVRGANGVILITTKRGNLGKPKITFDGQYSTSMPSKIPHTLRSYDANSLINNVIINEVGLREDAWKFYKPQEVLNYYNTQEYPEIFPDIDWTEQILKDASASYKFNTNIAGGTEFVKYFGSLGYLHEGGILNATDMGQGFLPNFSHDRFNFRSNLDFQFTPTTLISMNLAGNYSFTNDPGYSDNNQKIMKGIYSMPPDLYPIQYSDGTYANNKSFLYENPFVALNFSGLDRANVSQVFTDFKLEQKLDFITEGLKFSATASYDNKLVSRGPAYGSTQQAYKWISPEILNAQTASDSAGAVIWTTPQNSTGYDYVPPPVNRISEKFNSISRQLFYQFSFDYARDFGKHSVTGLVLMNRMEGASGSAFVSKREDWVGRATYNYDDRYFMEINAGYNGSEKFDSEYRFGLFPSLAGGWMVSNEKFFKEALPWWNTLKLRYSTGKVGSDDGIQRWLYVTNWTTSNAMLWFGDSPSGTGLQTTFEGEVANPHIHWETALKRNFGLESGFFKDRVLVNFEYFKDDRQDMLIAANQRTSNDIVGAQLPAANIGKTETSGMEIDLEYRYFSTSGLGVTTRLSYASAVDKTIFRDDPELRPDYQKNAGFPIGQTRSHIDQGIMQNWDDVYTSTLFLSNQEVLPGDFRILDFNADGVIDNDDIVPWGYPRRPQKSYTMNLGISYKGFSISAMFYGVFNVTMNQGYDLEIFRDQFSVAYPWNQNESWSPELNNTLSAEGQALRFLSSPTISGRYDYVDGSYVRLKNAEISYQLPKSVINEMGIASMSIYATGYNIFLWTKDEWREDREFTRAMASYPIMKRFSIGLRMGL